MHGKFPHRNPIMCRPHRAGEVHYLTSELRPPWSFTQPPQADYYALHAALHTCERFADCRAIDANLLRAFHGVVGLDADAPQRSLMDVFEVLKVERVSFRELYRHITLQRNAEIYASALASPGLAPHLRKVTLAIFKDGAADRAQRSGRAKVPKVIDVPALNVAIGCPLLDRGDVCVPRSAIEAFVTRTGFKRCAFSELHERYRVLVADASASFEHTSKGVRRSAPIERRAFERMASVLFEESPALEGVLTTLYELLDLDYDGTVDAGELLVALNALCSGGLEAKLDVCFDVFDRDGSGFLDRDELWDLLHTTLLRGLNLVEALFLQYLPEDRAPGGEELVLFSLADFSAIEQASVRALSEADADADGSVDRAEFRAWAAAHPLLGQLFRLSESLFGIA
jgi:Ca2+-binding EF-hand superfamily protein